ncbi:hypothetical protein H0H87_007970 [Tephrocybe sp. NHM501043]|nr:hypothetical protein H0H87_007970 [Tephrocybe sp. NHM501043]
MLPDDERPSRKPLSENRLYRFITRSLTRSRSRSRSRTRRDSPPPIDPNEPVPNLPPTQNGRIRIGSMGQSGPSKPATRIPSRPLSSTTTATNTTITPGTPRPKKRPPSSIPIREASKISPRETPKASATRKKLHNIFGIALPSPKKSSFNSSNHSSRRPSIDGAPPVLGFIHDLEDNDPTPKALRSYSPQPYTRAESPSPLMQQKLNHNPSTGSSAGTSSASGSSRLHKFFGGQRTPPHPSTDAVSGPIRRRPSNSSHRRGNSTSNSTSNHSSPTSAPDTPPSKSRPPGTMGPPPVPISRTGSVSQIAKSSSLGHSSRNNSVDFGHGGGGVDGLGSLNGHMRGKIGHSHGHSRRSTKHGSFDFERPGWSTAAAMQRTASGGTTASGTSVAGVSLASGWGRGHELEGIRESTMGPGLAGVGTLQRDVSMKRGKEREEMMNRAREEERRRRRTEAQGSREKASTNEMGVFPVKGQPTPRTLSPQDAGAIPPAKTSSWGRKHGVPFGKTKVSTLGLSHGAFSFEPPVPSPTWSTGSTGNGYTNGKSAPLTVSWAGEKGREKSRIKEDLERDKERWNGREKERRSQSAQRGDRAPVPVPTPSASMGHRSGTKGRSLDLGLGLSWAPTSVREDALLPASGYFGRTTSGSSSLGSRSVGRSVSGSTNGHATIEEESTVLGSHVAGVFKNALDDTGYRAFKRYVDRFDAHEIPFDGPTGIVTRVERLLMSAPDLSDDGKRQLLDKFVRVVLQHA